MTEFKIIKNRPMPSPERGSCKYPFAEMEVGDMFEVPLNSTPRRFAQSSVSRLARKYHPDRKYRTRRLDDDKIGVWRVE